LGTLFLVVFTFPANIFTMGLLVAGITVVFKAYIRVSRLFRRLASATMGSLNAFVTEHVNGVQVIRWGFGWNNAIHIDDLLGHFERKALVWTDACAKSTFTRDIHTLKWSPIVGSSSDFK